MIKDRNLKIKVVEYFLSRGWYPHMEVNVLSQNQISSSPKLVTDIDVLGLAPEVTGKYQIILGDCKTLKGQSPITRALWMKGLMEYFGAKKGIILLSKDIEKEHQLTADTFDVLLFSEEDFDFYSKATSDFGSFSRSALSDIENWDKFVEIEKRFERLKPLSDFARTDFWNSKNSNFQVRSGLALLRSLKGEVNPGHKLHLSIVLHHYSLIAIALNQIVIQLFTRYVSLKSKDDLSNDLKIIIYGGIENYEYLNELRRKFIGNSSVEKDLSLPEWDSFVELIRLSFENPINFHALPLYLKELSFCFLSQDAKIYNYANSINAKDKFTSTFALRLSQYLNKACQLPPEFDEIYSKAIVFNEI